MRESGWNFLNGELIQDLFDYLEDAHGDMEFDAALIDRDFIPYSGWVDLVDEEHHRDLNAAINLANYNLPGVPRCQSVDSSEPLPQRVVESPVVASTLNEAETKRHSVKNE